MTSKDMARPGRPVEHGHAQKGRMTQEYSAWARMKWRCSTTSPRYWANYGARGIAVAPEWAHDFLAFLSHVGPVPSRQHSLDRIDNDRGYEPGNVRWATRRQQQANTQSAIRVDGTCLKQACEARGICYNSALRRYQRGLRGEALLNPRKRVVLAPEDVIRIRERRAAGDRPSDIAKSYGVRPDHISRITNGSMWASVQANLSEVSHAAGE